MSRDSGSKVKKPKSVVNLAQPKVFEPLFRDGRSYWELVPNNFWGVAVVRLKVKGQKTKFTKT